MVHFLRRKRFLEQQLFLAFLGVGLIVVLVAGLGWVGNSQLAGHIATLQGQVFQNTIALADIDRGRLRIHGAERTLTNPFLEANIKKPAEETIATAWQDIDKGLSSYQFSSNTTEKKYFEDLKKAIEQWQNGHRALMQAAATFRQDELLLTPELLRQVLQVEKASAKQPTARQFTGQSTGQPGQPGQLTAVTENSSQHLALERTLEQLQRMRDLNTLRVQQAEPTYQAVNLALQVLWDYNQQAVAQVKVSAEQAVDRTRLGVLLGLILGPLTALLAGLYFTRAIIKPLGKKITRVVDIARRIAAGDLTEQSAMLESARSSGHNNTDEVSQLFGAFGQMNHDLGLLIRQVQGTSLQMNTAVHQISSSGRELEATFSEQVASTNQVAVTAREIAVRSDHLRQSIVEVTQKSQETAMTAGSSQKDLSVMEATMRQLMTATGSISNRLGIISEKANNINSVITTITKVADQTNLLSLNAAIEAEKAGEYGRGFAVVSREIRRLADQTAVATLDIEHMVKEMQSAVATGVMEMDQFTREVTTSVESIKNIGSQMADTIRQVKNLSPQFHKVSQGMEEQALGAQQISEAMTQLNEASLQTADALQEINQVLDSLNQSAQQLRQQISRFKVTPDER